MGRRVGLLAALASAAVCIAADGGGVTITPRLLERDVLSDSTLEIAIEATAETVALSECHVRFYEGRSPNDATLYPFARCEIAPSGRMTVGRSRPASVKLILGELRCTDTYSRPMSADVFTKWIDKGEWHAVVVVCDWGIVSGNRQDCYVWSSIVRPGERQEGAPPPGAGSGPVAGVSTP